MKQGLWKRIVNVLVVCLGFVAIYCGAATAEHDEGNGTSVPDFSHMEPRKIFTKEETVHVVYVGNSLLQVPGIPDKVNTYAENSGYHFENHSYLVSGGTLEKSLKRVALLDTMKQDLLDADVLVLQEYGNDYDTTYEDICEFVKLCGEDTEVYYYMTEFDYDVELLKKISYDERVHLIPASLIVEIASTDMGFEYDEMFKPGDYHPSQTYAHLCGLFTFSMISGQDCTQYPIVDDEKLMEYMKGDTIEAKKACFEEMYLIVDSIAGYYEEAVKGWK